MACHPESFDFAQDKLREGSAVRLLALVAALVMPSSVLAQSIDKELDTPYVPTPQPIVDRMLELAQVKPGDTVVDLGSGDGRIMITAAQKYGARGFGVELDPRLVRRSNDEARRVGVADRVKFLQQDLFKTDFHEANVLTLYLLPDVNMALRPRILAELKPGTRVVSHDYDMGVWRPEAQETLPAPDKAVGARKESTVYLWIVPAKVEFRRRSKARGKSKSASAEKRAASPSRWSSNIRGSQGPHASPKAAACPSPKEDFAATSSGLPCPAASSPATRSIWSGALRAIP